MHSVRAKAALSGGFESESLSGRPPAPRRACRRLGPARAHLTQTAVHAGVPSESNIGTGTRNARGAPGAEIAPRWHARPVLPGHLPQRRVLSEHDPGTGIMMMILPGPEDRDLA